MPASAFAEFGPPRGEEPKRAPSVPERNRPLKAATCTPGLEPPIRAEAFGTERLQVHARSLAAAHDTTEKPPKRRNLLSRVHENSRVLLDGYRSIAGTVLAKHEITPAAEWILDNFHVVDEQLREIRDHLPGSFYRGLPRIASGHLAGYPRVYGLAWAYVAHTDSLFGMESLRPFVRAYQRTLPLTIGELWAVAIHLRIALVENVRRLSQLVICSREERAKADQVADRLLGLGGRRVENADLVMGGLEDTPPTRAFAVQLVQRLHGQDPSMMPVVDWLETRLGAQGTSVDEVVAQEHQAQAAANVTVRNIITSMRWMSLVDWPEFFESVSLVDRVLRTAAGFTAMDFATRDRYRGQVERLARGSGRSEIEVAQEAVRLALRAGREDERTATSVPGVPERAEQDSGYYLVGGGRKTLERRLAYVVPLGTRLLRAVRAHALSGYLSAIVALTAVLLAVVLILSRSAGAHAWTLALMGLAGLTPASNIAVALVHRLVSLLVPPLLLPKLELERGVPPELRTLVVVPTFLTRRSDIEGQVERLEVHYLANPDGHLHFALLTDMADAPHERMAGDEDLVAACADGIAQLNARHGPLPDGGARFFHFHRRRLWNGKEGKWIGWERKRGKLHELNRLLRGSQDTTFVGRNGKPPTVPQGVRFVITLDADTRLPLRTARRLVGAMAHPLNRPRFDPRVGRVVAGYAILQPRLTASLPTGPASTTYQRIVSGPGGVDPYAAAVSDVYQDLFGEGSYTGKGIYDLDAYEEALEGRVPENTLLSHDLLESAYARAGLVTDVELFEEFPTNYEVASRRNHRWIRGDWQLLPWILNRAPYASGSTPTVAIPPDGRWKMVDNLRRSLTAPSTFLMVVGAWVLPGVPSLLWTVLFVGSVVLPAVIPVLDGLVPRRRGISKRSHLRAVGHDVSVALSQVLLAITMLAHQTWLMTGAIARTLGRLYLTRRNLLEWTTAAQADYGAALELTAFCWHLRSGVILGAAAGLLVALFRPEAWLVATPFVILWMASPVFAWWISVPSKATGSPELSSVEKNAVRRFARRTWRFFETFVDERNHALPPDNFQEDPEPVVARRTSPTNIGLYLLSTVVARDYGWIGTLEMVERLEATLETMRGLRRFRGHFLNWYDTQDLRPLDPMYVSTVDSGNLAGYLLAMAQACREHLQRPVTGPETGEGIEDALLLLTDSMEQTRGLRRARTMTAVHLREAAKAVAADLARGPATHADQREHLLRILERADDLGAAARPLSSELPGDAGSDVLLWACAVRDTVNSHLRDLELPEGALAGRLSRMARFAEELVEAMDFRFLFDSTGGLLAIGYRVSDDTLDPGRYDLLASEARLASFLAIAKGDVPPQHWFHLGRSLTPVGRGAALVSWSGSMFEYLMPLLVMSQPAHSLLDLTCRLVVARQIRYGAERRVPWGVSESAYNARDAELTYQYSAFGVPGLGLKRGLFEDVVVAPYATALAAMVDCGAALKNFTRLELEGARGTYGFYEALDYTPSRLTGTTTPVVVRSYMAHHHGMTLVALGNVSHDDRTRRRFHAHGMVQAAELLLQERTPRDVAITRPRTEEVQVAARVRAVLPPTLRHYDSPHDVIPRTHLLSNGRYTVMVTAAGSGFSRWCGLAVTRWREDTALDCWGTFLYVRDAGTGRVWSAGFQPTATAADKYDVVFSEDRAKITQRDRSLEISLEVVVSPEDDAELRRLTVTNLENRDRVLEFTSYAEVVLAPQAADEAHPAFSNLFVQSEFVPHLGALLVTRRLRSQDETPAWLAHLAALDGEAEGAVQYESDRARFLGRGRGVRAPSSVIDGDPLTNTSGTVLDPIVSVRHRVAIPALARARIVYTTLLARTREGALETAEKYQSSAAFEREGMLAWARARAQLPHLGIGQEEAHLFQRLANRLLYADPTLRASPRVLSMNRKGMSGLWSLGISGDLPIVVVQIEAGEDRSVVRQLLRAHEYWRLRGVSSDLVVLNAKGASYSQDLQEAVEAMVRASRTATGHETHGQQGEVLVLREDRLSEADLVLLRSAARVLILAGGGALSEQVSRLERPAAPPPRPHAPDAPADAVSLPEPTLEFFNGLGGFTPDGLEYVTVLEKGQWTPAPWINVVANQGFGFHVSESGSGPTWSVNSRENKLTPWSNDPVGDAPGETMYVRDEDDGRVWGPTCLPIREEASPYVIRHGQGYSRFEHTSRGIAMELLVFVPLDDPVKISRLVLENRSDRRRRLSVTAYAEWVLGVGRPGSAPFVVTDIDPSTKAMFARSAWNEEFADRVAFADLGGLQTSWTGDRLEFLGRNASLAHPESVDRGGRLSGRTGAGLDPCAALQTRLELEPGERAEIRFLLGQGGSREEARTLIERYRARSCDAVLAEIRGYWDGVLEAVQVKTPDRAMDLMLNRWLLYQTLSCRIWARTALYQSGGAYGFRDQLQDVLAFAGTRPDVTRKHLLRAASRQFREGDVQHWWHPPSGRGVRTRISDDGLWLAYAVAQYLRTTGDSSICDESVPWLEGPRLDADQQEAYFKPAESEDRATLYEHCARVLDRSLAAGSHGLPLIGGGDWNDGMNRVGSEGRGESVWLGWFLLVNLREFAKIAALRSDGERAARWGTRAAALEASLEREAWDGEWYRRAYFDDGTPLGSAVNDECRIDSISQSWAVLSGAGRLARARQAMASVQRLLVRSKDSLLLLLSPPFNATGLDPGYIKGYPPGIRENGAQYTHAAVWSVIAFAELGDGDEATRLFQLLNPIHHAGSREDVRSYKVEPYVVAADIYSEPPHVGRGGWTWYTGAAGWLHRAGLEWILGFRKRGSGLCIDPCIPRHWEGFEVAYRHGGTTYRITVRNPNAVCRGVTRLTLDGVQLPADALVPLSEDAGEHHVEVVLG